MRTRPGFISFYYGAMRARKTPEAVLAAEREQIARNDHRPVLFLKPGGDTRDADMRSFSGLSRKCELLPRSSRGAFNTLLERLTDKSICVIDEVQFLPLPKDRDYNDFVIDRYLQLFIAGAKAGCAIFLAGLDADFLGQPFDISRSLLLDPRVRRVQLYPVCATCGSEHATLTQRLFHGKPAPRSMPSILPEGENKAVTYEPRCLHCHVIEDEAIS